VSVLTFNADQIRRAVAHYARLTMTLKDGRAPAVRCVSLYEPADGGVSAVRAVVEFEDPEPGGDHADPC
jgi:hypothetical protein